jgi:hypothetical protein
MFAFEYVMAAALLTAPEESAALKQPPPLYDALRPALQELAIRWEIMDPREKRYVLARPEDFQADLKLLCRRYRRLLDAPRLADCYRFPDRATINDLLAFNRTYRQFLTARQPVDLVHAEELREALNETDQLYQVWDAVRDARCNYYYVTVRRQALQQLRTLIGERAYYAGILPPHVPLWRFPEID